MMTKEEKINWLRNATTEELLQQFESSVRSTGSITIAAQIEAQEDLRLVKDELRRRLA